MADAENRVPEAPVVNGAAARNGVVKALPGAPVAKLTVLAAGAETADTLPPSIAAAEPTPAANDQDGAWPTEAAEAEFLGEARERGEVQSEPTGRPGATAPDPSVTEEKTGPLPELDSLVSRLDPAVRQTLDELFRARFVSVRRVAKKALVNAAKKGDEK